MNTVFAKVPKTLGVSGFRADLAEHFAAAKKAPVVVTDRRGGETRVFLDRDVYNKLVEAWEDEQDAQELTRLVKEQRGKKFYPFKPTTR